MTTISKSKAAASNAQTPATDTPATDTPATDTPTPNAQGPEEALTDLDKAREELVSHIGDGQVRYEGYAKELNAAFGVGWAELSFGGRKLDEAEKSLRDRIRAEKDKFLAACKSRNIVNPSDAWASVRKWAVGKKRDNGARANEAREMTQRQKEELAKLYKAAMKDEDLSDLALQVNDAIGRTLRDLLKVDLATLVK